MPSNFVSDWEDNRWNMPWSLEFPYVKTGMGLFSFVPWDHLIAPQREDSLLPSLLDFSVCHSPLEEQAGYLLRSCSPIKTCNTTYLLLLAICCNCLSMKQSVAGTYMPSSQVKQAQIRSAQQPKWFHSPLRLSWGRKKPLHIFCKTFRMGWTLESNKTAFSILLP